MRRTGRTHTMNGSATRLGAGIVVLLAAILVLAGCSNNDPLAGYDDVDRSNPNVLVVGSQDYYSNEIVAEIYAHALEARGFDVQREFRIGQREAYMPELEAGSIDVFPEYTGPLLQYWQPKTDARLSEPVYRALVEAAPKRLRILNQAAATDQDTYVVTRQFAEKWHLASIADLAKVTEPITMGAPSEALQRPNGPKGLAGVYGVNVGFTPIEDGGGPLTVKALRDGSIQMAIMFTADPAVKDNDLVALADPKGQFLASHVVPVVSSRVNDEAARTINAVSAQLSADELVALNRRSVTEQLPAKRIAADWLKAHPVE